MDHGLGSSLTWRPLAVGDARSSADLLNAMEAADRVGEYYDEQDTLEELTAPFAELERGSLAALDGDVMVGFVKALYQPDAEEVHRVVLDGGVAPEHRRKGIGTVLLKAGIAAAEELHALHHPTLKLVVNVHKPETMAGLTELMRSQGFAPARYFQNLEHPLGDAVGDTTIPAGFQVEPWSRENDEEFRLIRNESFTDDWLWAPIPAEAWRSSLTNRSFRPEVSFLLRDTANGAPAAMLLAKSWDSDTAATGIRDARFMYLATQPAYRQRGIGGALLRYGLRAAADQGYDRVVGQVDSANPFRSYELYEKVGCTPTLRFVRWELEV